MITLDDRQGSAELLPEFKPYDVDAQLGRLKSADAAFVGEGPDGGVAMVGVERKGIGDFVSSMRSDRLGGFQIHEMAVYDFTVLIVEGRFQCGHHGELEVWRYGGRGKKGGWLPFVVGSRPVMFSEIWGHLLTITFIAGTIVIPTWDARQTVAILVRLYRWFQTPWEDHKSLDSIYAPVAEYPGWRGKARRGLSARPRPGPVEKVASQFPGVSAKAWGFGRVFGSVEEMVNAEVKELMAVEGVGKKGAEGIYGWLRANGGKGDGGKDHKR